jgi:hypothetical protein
VSKFSLFFGAFFMEKRVEFWDKNAFHLTWPGVRSRIIERTIVLNPEKMFREKVTSQSLKSIGFDPARSVLEIEFVTGGIYQYLNVSRKVYMELLSAKSKGRYFDYSIRDRFVCKKIK